LNNLFGGTMPAVTADTMTLPRIPTVAAPSRPRPVKSVTTAPRGFEGEGFPVRRAFAGVDLADLDPFVHMDQMGEVDYGAGEPKGTPWHPHRGFETFTYLMEGTFVHQDSHGGGGVIENGGTQYMTAGSGILHIETPPEALVRSGGLFHGIQLWINLPRAKKWLDPAYQPLEGTDVTLVSSADGGTLIRVLAGTVAGHTGPGRSQTPMAIVHATLAPGAQLDLPWPSDFNALAYALSGAGSVGPDRHPLAGGQLAVLRNGEHITLRAAASQSASSPTLEVLLLGGVPLREPVFAYGPFVMSTKSEIIQAIEDYQAGRFGVIPAGAVMPHRG
jgi:redox-sensitive bicupin YhaK (pirin superfamily)